jgi:methylenetetrahydrofolate reductase (NADPH)
LSATVSPVDAVAECAADLLSCGSIEMSAHLHDDVRALGKMLPAGTRVYVNHLPRQTLADTLTTLRAINDIGLDPVPHIAARRVVSRKELETFLQSAVGGAGVSKVLLIGGDDPQPLGAYEDSTALLKTGVLSACGVREVGFAGYPEGHARIPQPALTLALEEKLATARAQGLGAYVVTQFSFAPARVVEYCTALARRAPAVPVYVGLAGPTDPARLLRFAQRCGVSASLRALRAQGMGLVRVVTHTDPGEQLTAIARYCASHDNCNVVGVHLFSFGGAAKTAEWMNSRMAQLRAYGKS